MPRSSRSSRPRVIPCAAGPTAATGTVTPDGDDGALFQFLHFGHRRSSRRPHDVDGDIADLLAGADILISDRPGLPATLPRCTSASRSSSSCRSRPTASRVPTPVAPPPSSHCKPRAARSRSAGRADRAPVQMGGRTMEWVSGLYAAVAALAAHRVGARRWPRRARRRLGRRGGEHDGHDRRRPHGLPARSAQPRRARSQLRDAVDRADVRRLRRLQHQHPHAVRQLPPHDRAPRPHRGRATGRRSRTGS